MCNKFCETLAQAAEAIDESDLAPIKKRACNGRCEAKKLALALAAQAATKPTEDIRSSWSNL